MRRAWYDPRPALFRVRVFSFPLEGYVAVPAYYIDLPRGANARAAFRADIFDTAVFGFAAALFSFAVPFRQAGRADRVVAQSLRQPCGGFGGNVSSKNY